MFVGKSVKEKKRNVVIITRLPILLSLLQSKILKNAFFKNLPLVVAAQPQFVLILFLF